MVNKLEVKYMWKSFSKKTASKAWEQPELNYWKLVDEFIHEPHILIGGATGSGKSVMMNDILYTLSADHPMNIEVYIIDLKMVEYTEWDIPHIKKIVDDPRNVNALLDSIIDRMNARYRTLKEQKLKLWRGSDIYLIIDEMTEVLKSKEAKAKIDTIMRLGRASKIHVVGATQDVSRTTGIPAELQKNFSVCIGLRCKSANDSRQIIGEAGCEKLPKYGEALVSYSMHTERVKVPFTSDESICERNRAYIGYR